jgi:sodium transport system permease protein
MTFTNVKLILAREVRDQLRDRRTLFMIFVLPILLYPLLGTACFQLSQFQTKKMSVLVVGGGQLADAPSPLIDGDSFAPQLFPGGANAATLLNVKMAPPRQAGDSDTAGEETEAARQVQAKDVDAALVFPPDFAARLKAYRDAIAGGKDEGGRMKDKGIGGSSAAVTASIQDHRATADILHPSSFLPIPRPKVIYNSAHDRSAVACQRLNSVLDRWMDEIGKTNLAAGGMAAEAMRPFDVEPLNLAGESAGATANLWPRLLPVMLLLWAMTGAFYPAIDLCAGEKERGTLETLLSSPAERSEIVVGKLLTIMAFSMVTAALNLVGVGITGILVVRQIDHFGGPPPLAALWLSLALIPVSALFSALCLALASFARSTKEGQYYLMPLIMLSMPMAVLPMSLGVELNLGNSLIPISGLMLLLKTLLEGSYIQALQFLPIVLAVTMASCWLAVRWAVEQFNKESVIFRESERFAVGIWLRRLMRDRDSTPSVAEGLFCGVVILVVSFLMRSAVAMPANFDGFARVTIVLQLAAIFMPALLMAVILTSSPRQTLLLRQPRWRMLPAAALLAVALHPFIIALNALVMHLYPMAPEMVQAVGKLEKQFASADLGLLILCVAVTPAICEELAFRGFVLSGLRNLGNDWRAILVSAIFFGATHAFLQQSINACLMGIVLAFLAVRTGSLLPGVLFHFLHNAMTVLSAKVTPELLDRVPGLGFLVQSGADGPAYQWPVYLFGGVTSLALLGWFAWFPEARSPDDVLQEVFKKSSEKAFGDEDGAEAFPAG